MRLPTRTIAVTLLAAVTAFPTAGMAAVSRLRYGQNAASAHDISTLPQTVAIRKGFFTREGLALDVVPTGAFDLVGALENGNIDISRIATPYLVAAVVKGSDLVAIASQTANPVYSLVARPEIARFADLKGKLLGLSIPVDTITLVMRKLMALNGVPNHDYRVKAVVGTVARFACLKSGRMRGGADASTRRPRGGAIGISPARRVHRGRRPRLQRRHGAAHLGAGA